MRVTVKGKNFNVADSLRGYAEDKVGKASRIIPNAVHTSDVELAEQKNPRVAEHYVCEVTMSAANGKIIRATGSATEPHAAVDVVVGRLEQQLRKLKGKLQRRSRPRHRAEKTTPPNEPSEEEVSIVRRKQFSSKPMSTEEAVLQLDLIGHDFFLFNNIDTEQAAVVYRRQDGNFGLIELD